MLVIKKNLSSKDAAQVAADTINNSIASSNGSKSLMGAVGVIGACEGYDEAPIFAQAADAVTHLQESIVSTLAPLYGAAHVDTATGAVTHTLSDIQIEAALQSSIASADPVAWHTAINNAGPQKDAILNAVPQFDIGIGQDVAGTEAFEEQAITGFTGFNAIYNLNSVTLAPSVEMLFPTIPVAHNKFGASVRVERTAVMNPGNRSASGKAYVMEKRTLIDARINPEILNNDVLKLVPVVRASGEDINLDYFADPKLIAHRETTYRGEQVTTAPLLFVGEEIDFLGISQVPGMAHQAADWRDTLARKFGYESLYVLVTKTAGTGAEATTVSEIVKFDVKTLPGTTFIKKEVDGGTDNVLFNTADTCLTYINAATVLANQTKTEIFKDLGDVTVQLRTRFGGEVSLETGNGMMDALACTVHALVRNAGTDDEEYIGANTDSAKALLAGIKFKLYAYDPEASITNSNLKETSLQATTDAKTFYFNTELHSPVTFSSPLMGQGSDAAKVGGEAARTLARLNVTRANNNGNTAIFNWMAMVERYYLLYKQEGWQKTILGVASMFVKPYFKRKVIDVLKEINSTKSHEKLDDFQALITDTARTYAAIMDEKSHMSVALDERQSGDSKRLKVCAICDPILNQQMYAEGDERTLGNYKFQIEVEHDIRWKNKLLLTFGIDGVKNSYDELHFGARFWTSDLMITASVLRNGSNVQEIISHPRYSFIPNLPVMTLLDFVNLDHVFSSKIDAPAQQVKEAPVEPATK